jgi:hypothetical protein
MSCPRNPALSRFIAMNPRTATCLPATRPLPTPIEASRGFADGAKQHAALIPLVRRPWLLRAGTANLLIRPAVTALQRQLRRPLCFVAATPRGAILAMAIAGIDVNHGAESAQIGILVEDEWQGIGIGRELIVHLAGAAVVCGYTEMIAYTATSTVPIQRLLHEVGHPRLVADPTHSHLHTTLPESAALGLGAVRERLAS